VLPGRAAAPPINPKNFRGSIPPLVRSAGPEVNIEDFDLHKCLRADRLGSGLKVRLGHQQK
jgi:hypothetical protein